MKVTVPVGVPLGVLTFAVNTIAWPGALGFTEEMIFVLLELMFTI